MNDSVIRKEQYFFFLDAGIPYEGWVDYGDGVVAYALKVVEVVNVPINKYKHQLLKIQNISICVVDNTYVNIHQKDIKITKAKNVSIAKTSNSTISVSDSSAKQGSYDKIRAVTKIDENALEKSSGYCAKYVRYALEAGGINTLGRPNSAKDYDAFLLKKGFKQIDSVNVTFLEGDIAVIKSFVGDTKNHQHGHIQMYNGKQWVSDFKQRDFWPGQDYRKHKPQYKIFRWK